MFPGTSEGAPCPQMRGALPHLCSGVPSAWLLLLSGFPGQPLWVSAHRPPTLIYSVCFFFFAIALLANLMDLLTLKPLVSKYRP